jgi:protein-tyrosine phosphatase
VAVPPFVDIHSHVVPSGDDGAQSVEEGLTLCRAAAAWGTRVLFATPHVWPNFPLDRARERAVRDAYGRMAEHAGLELRLGFELTPTAELLAEDPRRYRLAGTEHVLMEVPFAGRADPLFALAEHTERAGLQPVIAHPERAEAVLADPDVALELAERGWLLQLNATSLIGYHGAHVEALAWQLVEDGHAAIVASDGHRSERPPQLDRAYAIVRARLGEARACSLFDGSALGLGAAETAASARTPSRAASRGA